MIALSPIVAAVLAGAGMLALAVGLLAWLRRKIQSLRSEGQRRALAEVAGQETLLVDAMANCFGFESLGRLAVRGNGCLVLTADAFVFAQWMPVRTVKIALGEIREVKRVRSHLGKGVRTPLLRVAFEKDGEADSVAWLVSDLAAWQAALSRHPSSPQR